MKRFYEEAFYEAEVIVTQNLKDFPAYLLQPFEVEAQSPDDFISHLFYLDRERMIQILLNQASDLRKPPKTILELLDTLNQHTPQFVNLVRRSVNGELY
jgi:hypothetical protein